MAVFAWPEVCVVGRGDILYAACGRNSDVDVDMVELLLRWARPRPDLIRDFLDAATVVKSAKKYSMTVLMATCVRNQVEIVKRLLAAGADADAVRDIREDFPCSPLYAAVVSGHADVVQALLAADSPAHVMPAGSSVQLGAKTVPHPSDVSRLAFHIDRALAKGAMQAPVAARMRSLLQLLK